MKKVIISCPKLKKPAKVCELVKDDSGEIRMEIKFPGSDIISINLSDYLKQLQS